MEKIEKHVRRSSSIPTKGFGRLGKQIKISPKAQVSILAPGYKTEYFVDSILVSIGIGKDHTATLIMSMEAWDALNDGAPIHITTTEEYRKMYIYKVRKGGKR